MNTVAPNTTDRSEYLSIVSSITGLPATGLDYTDVGSACYVRSGAEAVEITPITLAGADAAHSDGGFVEVDASLAPGIYRFDVPDAAYASGVSEVIVQANIDGDYVARPVKLQIGNAELAVTLSRPISGFAQANRVREQSIVGYKGFAFLPPPIAVRNDDGSAADLTGRTFVFTAWRESDNTQLFTLSDPTIAANYVTFTGTDSHTATAGSFRWNVSDIDADQVVARGTLTIEEEVPPS